MYYETLNDLNQAKESYELKLQHIHKETQKKLNEQAEQLAYLESKYAEVVLEKTEKERVCKELKSTAASYKKLIDNIQNSLEGHVTAVKEKLHRISPASIAMSSSTSTLA